MQNEQTTQDWGWFPRRSYTNHHGTVRVLPARCTWRLEVHSFCKRNIFLDYRYDFGTLQLGKDLCLQVASCGSCNTHLFNPEKPYFRFQILECPRVGQYLNTFGVSTNIVQFWFVFKVQNRLVSFLKTIALDKVTNRWRNHNNKTMKISELNKIIELYEL